MVWSSSFALASAALQLGTALAAGNGATWPNAYDELEDIMVLNNGYNARGLSLPVTPCDLEHVAGFVPSGGFLRTAFHDVAPHIAASGQGGLDASIAFELTGEGGKDNAGPFANNTLTFLQRYYSEQASMSDLIALATYTAVRSCGGPIIAIRTGRVDATEAGPIGVPKVEGTQEELKDTFTRMGFTTKEMITLTACGHTLGGVHVKQFPKVTDGLDNGAPDVNFDSTPSKFDNAIAVEFVKNTTHNPLVIGTAKFASDGKVFTADGMQTIRQLTDPSVFQAQCQILLAKMLDTVPAGVQLTEAITVYDVKPGSIQLELSDDGKLLLFAGEIRVRTSKSSVKSVSIVYYADGKKQDEITTTVAGTASGHDDAFTFYSFSEEIDAKTGIDSFTVTITESDGSSSSYDNNGKSYGVDDTVFVQRSTCSVGKADKSGNVVVEIVAAARDYASKLTVVSHTQTPREVPLPKLETASSPMKEDSSNGDFTFYKAQFTINIKQIDTTTFDIVYSAKGKDATIKFQRLTGLTGSDQNADDNNDDEDDTGFQHGQHGHPCGEDEACDAAPWATKTKLTVPTPPAQVIIDHGGKGGYGGGKGGIGEHGGKDGASWNAPTKPTTTKAPAKPTTTVWADNTAWADNNGWADNKPTPAKPDEVKPTMAKPGDAKPTGEPKVAPYLGAASRDGASNALLVGMFAAVGFAMVAL